MGIKARLNLETLRDFGFFICIVFRYIGLRYIIELFIENQEKILYFINHKGSKAQRNHKNLYFNFSHGIHENGPRISRINTNYLTLGIPGKIRYRILQVPSIITNPFMAGSKGNHSCNFYYVV
ncbi:MAG: hypothetical protein A2Y94_15725 [Caldithrix sp. RBG_13_44_9]|nr:MAG: hypothetical protein A2Y94_15725 [Caldithrix sp. RBG_13_44_9]